MVDFGKIIALHNAGLGIAKIADEMRLTEQEYCDTIAEKLDEIDAQIGRLEREYRKYVSLVQERSNKRNEIKSMA